MKTHIIHSVCYVGIGFAAALILFSGQVVHAAPQEDEAEGGDEQKADPSPAAKTPQEEPEQSTSESSDQANADTQTDDEPVEEGTEEKDKEEPSFKESAEAFFGSMGIRKLPDESFPGMTPETRDGSYRKWYLYWLEQNTWGDWMKFSRLRGIPGGSLGATFHGAQWPYAPESGIGFSGNVWLDTSFKENDSGLEGQQTIQYFLTQGRFVLRVTPTYTKDDWFIQGQVELVGNTEQHEAQPRVVDTDDLWIRFGQWGRRNNNWDIQAGRFEGFEVYHLGMGLDLNTFERDGAYDENKSAPDLYGVTWAYYRPSGVGNLALHYYPFPFWRMEGLAQYGNQGGLNTFSFRGANVFDFGFVKFKAGAEIKKQQRIQEGSTEKRLYRGVGGSLQFVFAPWVETGMSCAYAIVDRVDNRGGVVDKPGSIEKYTFGPFLNLSPIPDLTVGGGVHYTKQWDIHENPSLSNRHGQFSHYQIFGAVQYRLFGQLYVKPVVAFARARFAPSFEQHYTNEMFSVRLRLRYFF